MPVNWHVAGRAGFLPGMPSISRHAVALAAEAEKTLLHARTIGLAEDDAREVIRAWSVWYQQTPWPLPWSQVREAMTHRAMGNEWRPPMPGATGERGRPIPGGYLDRLFADLKTTTAPPPTFTLADLNAIMARLRPHTLFAHPDRVDALRRAAAEQDLPVVVHAVPWIHDPEQAYLVAPGHTAGHCGVSMVPHCFGPDATTAPTGAADATASTANSTADTTTPTQEHRRLMAASQPVEPLPQRRSNPFHPGDPVTTMDPARIARARRIHAAYDRRRHARRRRR